MPMQKYDPQVVLIYTVLYGLYGTTVYGLYGTTEYGQPLHNAPVTGQMRQGSHMGSAKRDNREQTEWCSVV